MTTPAATRLSIAAAGRAPGSSRATGRRRVRGGGLVGEQATAPTGRRDASSSVRGHASPRRRTRPPRGSSGARRVPRLCHPWPGRAPGAAARAGPTAARGRAPPGRSGCRPGCGPPSRTPPGTRAPRRRATGRPAPRGRRRGGPPGRCGEGRGASGGERGPGRDPVDRAGDPADTPAGRAHPRTSPAAARDTALTIVRIRAQWGGPA
jgi:hypothetical protein